MTGHSDLPHLPTNSGWSLRPGPRRRSLVADTHFLTPATGGYDPHIRLWNPLVSKKPVWLMKGHQTSVTHLLVNSQNTSILISVSRDKVSPLWNIPLSPIPLALFPRKRH